MFLVSPLHVGAIEIAHHAQRDARDVADAERDRAHVHVGEVAVEQVGHDLQLAGDEDLFRNLAAGVEAGAGQGDAALGARQLHLERAAVVATA